MALIATGFLPLSEVAGVQVVHGLPDTPVAATGLEMRDGFVDEFGIVTQHADGQDARDVGQAPVGPVVRVHGRVDTGQESMADWVEDLAHHRLECRQAAGTPTTVAAHDLGRVGELVAVDAGGQRYVTAAKGGQRRRPLIQILDRLIGVLLVARHLPAQRIAIGGRNVVVKGTVVLPMRWVIAPVDGGLWIRLVRQASVAVCDEHIPAIDPGGRVGLHLGAHACEILFGMQQTWMRETLNLHGAVRRRDWRLANRRAGHLTAPCRRCRRNTRSGSIIALTSTSAQQQGPQPRDEVAA